MSPATSNPAPAKKVRTTTPNPRFTTRFNSGFTPTSWNAKGFSGPPRIRLGHTRKGSSLRLRSPYGKRNPRTLWQDYEDALREAQAIIATAWKHCLPSGRLQALPLVYACVKQLRASDDLTMIPELGRSKRDVMYGSIRTVAQLANTDTDSFAIGSKTCSSGIGPDTLRKFQHAQAVDAKDGSPTRAHLSLSQHERELFFDIEVDPMRDICYLHGFVERLAATTRRNYSFSSPKCHAGGRERAFAEAWAT